MSMQDSAAIAGLTMINPALGKMGTMLLGGASATQTMLDAVEKGANDEQALAVGTLRGLLEMALAKVKVGELIGGGNKVVTKIIDQIISAGLDDVFSNIEFRKKRE